MFSCPSKRDPNPQKILLCNVIFQPTIELNNLVNIVTNTTWHECQKHSTSTHLVTLVKAFGWATYHLCRVVLLVRLNLASGAAPMFHILCRVGFIARRLRRPITRIPTVPNMNQNLCAAPTMKWPCAAFLVGSWIYNTTSIQFSSDI